MALPAVFRRRVKHDLSAAYDWYEGQRPGLGAEFRASVQATFKAIEVHPELFATADLEIHRAIVSRFPFAVFYVVEPKRVVVLRVLHTARNPGLWPRPQSKPR